MGAFQDLRVWQQAMALAVLVYRTTETFPKHELYGLTSQLRRASVSIASNIAEGKGHRSGREFLHFLYHARGSLYEVETQVLLGKELGFISPDQANKLVGSITSVARSLAGLINSLEEKSAAASAS